jgi:hypothetical protein
MSRVLSQLHAGLKISQVEFGSRSKASRVLGLPSKASTAAVAQFSVGSCVRARMDAGWFAGIVSSVEKNSKGQFSGVYKVIFNVGTWENITTPQELVFKASDVSVRVPVPAAIKDGAGSGAGLITRSTPVTDAVAAEPEVDLSIYSRFNSLQVKVNLPRLPSQRRLPKQLRAWPSLQLPPSLMPSLQSLK